MHKQNKSDSEQLVKSLNSRYGSLRPVDFHSFIGVTRKSTVTPPAVKGKQSKRNLVTPKVTHTHRGNLLVSTNTCLHVASADFGKQQSIGLTLLSAFSWTMFTAGHMSLAEA